MSPSLIANYEDRTTQGILERSQVESRTRLRTHRKRVPDPKWHAFAIYSRPIVNGVEVHNTFTPSPTPYRNIDLKDITLEEVFPSLRSPNGGEHPEMWVRGLHHPALPPPPVGWDLPREGEPLAFPWECELNPLLEHVVFGPAPLYWHMGHPARLIMFGGEDTAAAPLFDTDYAQPATKPLLTHMYINAIADQDSFPWPIMVANTRGIRCRDIFDAISLNFQQFILQSEYDDWDETRRKHCLVEYDARGGPLTNDGVRRLDYLGGRVWFRGLAPNPNREGWVLFVGLA